MEWHFEFYPCHRFVLYTLLNALRISMKAHQFWWVFVVRNHNLTHTFIFSWLKGVMFERISSFCTGKHTHKYKTMRLLKIYANNPFLTLCHSNDRFLQGILLTLKDKQYSILSQKPIDVVTFELCRIRPNWNGIHPIEATYDVHWSQMKCRRCRQAICLLADFQFSLWCAPCQLIDVINKDFTGIALISTISQKNCCLSVCLYVGLSFWSKPYWHYEYISCFDSIYK